MWNIYKEQQRNNRKKQHWRWVTSRRWARIREDRNCVRGTDNAQFSCGGSQGFANLLHPNLPEGHIHIFILSNNIVSIGSGGEKGGRSSPGTCLPPSPVKVILPQIQISIPLTTRVNSGSIPSTPWCFPQLCGTLTRRSSSSNSDTSGIMSSLLWCKQF